MYKSTRNNPSRTTKIEFNIMTPSYKQGSMMNQHVENYMKRSQASDRDFDKIKTIDNNCILKFEGKTEKRRLNFENISRPQSNSQYADRILPSECVSNNNSRQNLIQYYLRESTIAPADKTQESKFKPSMT